MEEIREQTWNCGAVSATVTATLRGGTLTLRGDGAVVEYDNPKAAPWYDFRDSIVDVIVEEGVTSIEGHTLCDCLNLKSVILQCRNSVDAAYFDLSTFKGSDNLTLGGMIFMNLDEPDATV